MSHFALLFFFFRLFNQTNIHQLQQPCNLISDGTLSQQERERKNRCVFILVGPKDTKRGSGWGGGAEADSTLSSREYVQMENNNKEKEIFACQSHGG